MPVFRKGQIELDLKFLKVGGELDEEDRQCAWALYCEIVSRRAVSGRLVRAEHDGEAWVDGFEGEVLAESFDSLHAFFERARELMSEFPVGRIGKREHHLGFFILRMMEIVIRPFLEKWQARYRHWWSMTDDETSPFERQQSYPHWQELTADWSAMRSFCRETATELVETYELVELSKDLEVVRRAWWSGRAT